MSPDGPAGGDASAAARTKAARWRGEATYALLFTGLYMALGAQIGFLNLWLEDWGLAASEIGWVHAAAVAARIVAGAGAPALADRLGRPAAMMTAMALAGLLAGGALALAGSRLEVYILTIILAVSYAALIPLSDAHGYASAERLGFSYRRARSVGSAAFLLATLLCGETIGLFGADATLWWIVIPYALCAAAAMVAPVGLKTPLAAPSGPPGDAPGPLLAPSDARPAQAAARGASWLLAPRFLVFLLAVAAIQSSHGVYYVYGSIHWKSLGYSEAVIGRLWSWGVLVEIMVFAVGASLMARLGARGALILTGAVAAARWSLMAFDPPLAVVAALQATHGLTFGLTLLATLAFVQAAVPADRTATAQGLVSATAGGLGMLLVTMAAAELYPMLAGGAYWIGAASAVIGVVAALALPSKRFAGPAARR